MYALGLQEKDIDLIQNVPLAERLPSKYLKIFKCDQPTPKADEVQIKVLGAGLNFNSVWQSICHPVTPKNLIDGHVRRNPEDTHHLRDYYIFGSDGAGIITEIGDNVKDWKVGDEVVIHCNVVSKNELSEDQMKYKSHSIWGYETNFGSFAEYTCVKETQLVQKPKHLSWAEAGSYMLTLATSYRMLLSKNGANLKKGDFCLIWGASGGLGSYAIQLCNLIGAIPVAIVSNKAKANYCEKLGCKFIINLEEIGIKNFILENGEPNYLSWKKFKNQIFSLIKTDVDVVFEHIGRDTLGLSIYLLKKGGKVPICAASSGYLSTIDLRYLWMDVKQIIGCHFANFDEIKKSNELVQSGKIKTTTDTIIEFDHIPYYLDKMYKREIVGGKIGVNFNVT